MLIRLCRPFWIAGTLSTGRPSVRMFTQNSRPRRSSTEASHLTHCTGDLRGRTIGVAECLAQFVAATNDSWLHPRFVDVCVGAERCPAETKVFQGESPGPGFARRGSKGMGILGTFSGDKMRSALGRPAVRKRRSTQPELEDEYFDEPYHWPQWPTSRTFNPPPAQTIPAGPYKTFSPCQAIEDDFGKLMLAVDDLRNPLCQRPSNWHA